MYALNLVPQTETTQYHLSKVQPCLHLEHKTWCHTVTVLGGRILTCCPSLPCICFLSYKSKWSDQEFSEVPSNSDISVILRPKEGPQIPAGAFKAFPMCVLVWVWRVYVSRGMQAGGGAGRDPKPNDEASMGTALTTSSGLEPIQGIQR